MEYIKKNFGSLPVFVKGLMLLSQLCSAVVVHGPTSGLRIGSTLQLRCEAGVSEEVTWYHNGMRVTNNQFYELERTVDSRHSYTTVTVRNVQMADAGQYKCQNNANSADQMHVDISISVAQDPTGTVEIVDPPQSEISLHEGEDLRLKCQGGRYTSLQWKHRGTVLFENTPGSRIIITGSMDIMTGNMITILSRQNMTALNSGVYSCQDSRNPSSMAQVTVTVAPNPPGIVPVSIYEPTSSTLKVKVAHMLDLKCKSDTSTTLVWLHNGVIQSHNTRFQITDGEDEDTGMKTSLLSKPQAALNDAGLYRCQDAANASNGDYVTVTVEAETTEASASAGGNYPVRHRHYRMMVGSVINLTCSYQSATTHHLKWTKDGLPLRSSNKYSLRQDTDMAHTLVVQNTDEADAGLYQCIFKHRVTGNIAGVIVFNVTTVGCHALSPPLHGAFTRCSHQPLLGDICTFHCNPGYKLSHNQTLMCMVDTNMNGTRWSRRPPICRRMSQEEIEAAIPFSVSHVVLRAGGVQTLQCNMRSEWSREGHHGTLQTSDKYTVNNRQGLLSIHHTSASDSGVYYCKIYHTNNRTILGIKKYNISTLSCPPLEVPKNGKVSMCSSSPVYGEICLFRCDPGFKLTGSRSRICDVTSDPRQQIYWTGQSPQCQGSSISTPTQDGKTSNSSASSLLNFNIKQLCMILTLGAILSLNTWRGSTL